MVLDPFAPVLDTPTAGSGGPVDGSTLATSALRAAGWSPSWPGAPSHDETPGRFCEGRVQP
jgi:hypothetical protein